jgi:hypothetical protein
MNTKTFIIGAMAVITIMLIMRNNQKSTASIPVFTDNRPPFVPTGGLLYPSGVTGGSLPSFVTNTISILKSA